MASYDPEKHHRRSIRLKGYDYALAGAYAFTLCTEGRLCLLGEVVAGGVQLTAAGEMVWQLWEALPARFSDVVLGEFVAMPNHVHGILALAGGCRAELTGGGHVQGGHKEGDHKDRPYNPVSGSVRPVSPAEDPTWPRGTASRSLGRLLQAYKSLTTHEYIIGVRERGWPAFEGRLWERNYYERIVRNERELDAIREYIANNPAQWAADRENPRRW